MLRALRTPLLILALILIGLVVVVEVGASLGLGADTPSPAAFKNSIRSVDPDLDADEIAKSLPKLAEAEKPPGLAIPYMALLDGLVLLTVGLMTLSLIIPTSTHGRIQGIITFIVSLLVILGAIMLIFIAIALLMTMVGLFLAIPFGLIAYMAIWSFFDTGGAAAVLSMILVLKLCFAVSLVLAHQRFLENKGLVLIILTSLLCNVIVSFLHGFVPVFLVSIADVLGAIIVAILAAIWAIVFLIGSIPSIIKALRVDRALAS